MNVFYCFIVIINYIAYPSNGNKEQSCVINGRAKLNCIEKVIYKLKDFEISNGRYIELNYFSFQKYFIIQMFNKEIPEFNLSFKNKSKTKENITYIYIGEIKGKSNSYAYATYKDGVLSGTLEDESVLYELNTIGNSTLSVRLESVDHETFDFTSDRNRRSRRSYYGKDRYRVCTLNIVLSEFYYVDICKSTIGICVERILWMINFMDRYFRRVDFDLDGQVDNIGFILRNLSFVDDSNDTLRYSRNSNKLLRTFSHHNHGTECMHVLIVNRWLEGGVLGLAFSPSIDLMKSTPGGICYSHISLVNKFVNTAMVTEQSKDGSLTARHVAITLMHELGHSFGAPHDTRKQCKYYRGFGNFIMYDSTHNLFNPNVVRFSICSRIYMKPIISQNGRCLLELSYYRTCGDFQVSDTEECDCGSDVKYCLKFDKCCSLPINGVGSCKINVANDYVCSARKNACCKDCQVLRQPLLCREGDECIEDSYCDTFSYECPASIPRTDGTSCASGSRVCKNGRCIGSICRLNGWYDCYCNSSYASMCLRCCKVDIDSMCMPSYMVDRYDELEVPIQLQESDICNHGHGFCSKKGYCQLFIPSSFTVNETSKNEIRTILWIITIFISINLCCYMMSHIKVVVIYDLSFITLSITLYIENIFGNLSNFNYFNFLVRKK